MSYRERVPAAGWFRWVVRLLGIAPLSISFIAALLADDAGSGERATLGVTALLTTLVLVLADRWFMVLHVTVQHGAVEARFGPFHRRFSAVQIVAAEDVPYRWTRYGGWGIRGLGKRQAWSVPFLKTGVEFALRDGRRYFISSRTPRPFLDAVRTFVQQPGGMRG